MKQIKTLVIGQGFMGGIAHSRGILEANQQLRPKGIELVLECVAGRDAAKLEGTQKAYGYNRTSTNWEKEIGKADLVVWRNTDATWYWLTSSSRYSAAAQVGVHWGTTGDTPIMR